MTTNGSQEDVRPSRDATRHDFAWREKTYTVTMKPLLWLTEKEAVRRCSSGKGIDPGDYVDFVLDQCVDQAGTSVPLGKQDRLGYDPDFVWTVARETGILARLGRLGVQLLSKSAMQKGIEDLTRQFLLVERRLRKDGYSLSELDGLPADRVRELYAVAQDEVLAEIEAQAVVLAEVLRQRLGV